MRITSDTGDQHCYQFTHSTERGTTPILGFNHPLLLFITTKTGSDAPRGASDLSFRPYLPEYRHRMNANWRTICASLISAGSMIHQCNSAASRSMGEQAEDKVVDPDLCATRRECSSAVNLAVVQRSVYTVHRGSNRQFGWRTGRCRKVA